MTTKSVPVTLPDGDVVKGHITDVRHGRRSGRSRRTGRGRRRRRRTEDLGDARPEPSRRAPRSAPISVELVEQVRRHVLAVPATSPFATAGGRYAVEALKRGRRVELPVTPAMFADGTSRWKAAASTVLNPVLTIADVPVGRGASARS